MSLEITDDLIARQPPEAQAIIRILLAKIAELEARLNKTPQNSSLPPGVPRGQSGPRLIAFVALLMAYFRQSKRRTALFVTSLLHIPCCPSLTIKHQRLATQALRNGYDELAAALPSEPQLHGDESPAKEAATKAWLWTFVEVEGVEPTNNAAERSLRHAVIWRKLSFGTQSAAGSRFVETMLSVIETCRQQERNVFEFVTQSVQAHFHGHKAPSLLPRA